jgi:hypothetical protein
MGNTIALAARSGGGWSGSIVLELVAEPVRIGFMGVVGDVNVCYDYLLLIYLI